MVVHAKPSYYANRGTLSLYAREIRMVGLGELLARLERRRQLLAAEGLFAPELKRALPVPAGLRRAGHRAQLGRRARRPRERPPPLARRTLRGRARRDAGHPRRRRGDRGGRPARPQPRRRRDRGRPRRRLGRGPAAVLRRGADPGGPPGPHARRVRDRPRARPAAARPGRRRPRLHPHRRRQAGRPRRRRGAAPASTRPATGSAPPSPASWSRASRPGSTPCGPARPSPTRARWSPPAPTRSTCCATGPAAACGTPSTAPRDDLGHQRARARALSPLATLQRGYAVLQDADGHVRQLRRRRRRRRRRVGPGRRRPHPRHHHRGRGRPRRARGER